jgi:hypothetical protein
VGGARPAAAPVAAAAAQQAGSGSSPAGARRGAGGSPRGKSEFRLVVASIQAGFQCPLGSRQQQQQQGPGQRAAPAVLQPTVARRRHRSQSSRLSSCWLQLKAGQPHSTRRPLPASRQRAAAALEGRGPASG